MASLLALSQCEDSNKLFPRKFSSAAQVGLHLVIKPSQGLFQRAIMESNPLGLPMMPLKEGQDFGDKLAKAFKCQDGNDITCLRALSVEVRVSKYCTLG